MKVQRLVLVMSVLLFVLLQFPAVSYAVPGPSLDIDIDVPPTVVLEPCDNGTFQAGVFNSGDANKLGDALQFTTITAVVNDSSLLEFVPTASVNARILAPDGGERWSGTVVGNLETIDYAPFGVGCAAITYRLPDDVMLWGQETLLLTVEVHCLQEGDALIHVFARATEDHHAVAPTDLTQITDAKNLYSWEGTPHVPAGWYPLHTSLDPKDSGYPSGHSFWQHSWLPKNDSPSYSRAEVMVFQRPQEGEKDCFTEQELSFDVGISFTVGHKLAARVENNDVILEPLKLLPGDTGTGGFTFTVWSNDEVEYHMDNTAFTGDDKGINDETANGSDWGPEAKYDDDENAPHTIAANRLLITVDGNSYTQSTWEPLMSPNGPTGDAGVSHAVGLSLGPITYSDHAGYYQGTLTLNIRQY